MLTTTELKKYIHYCPDTGVFTRLISTSSNAKIGDIAGCKTNDGYLKIRIKSIQYKAHRLAWLYITGHFPDKVIDHINGIKTDNRFVNLRNVSQQINLNNKNKEKIYKTIYLGASWHKASNKWRSQKRIGNKMIHLGLFSTKQDAHNAYLNAK